MLTNFFKITLRSFAKNRLYTFINVAGLSIGLACFILIGLYVKNETSYDQFFADADNIYRLNTYVDVNGEQNRYPTAHYPAAFDMVADFPEVENAATLFKPFYLSNVVPRIKYGEDEYDEKKFFMADSSFFTLFDFDFQYGNAEKAFENSYSVVLTSETAKRYFGNENPMGKLITFQDTTSFKVTGVLAPFQGHSHFNFDFLAHSKLLINQLIGFRIDHDYRGLWYYSYLKLADGANPIATENKLPDFTKKYYPPRYTDNNIVLKLQNLKDIHLHSDFSTADMSVNGNIQYVYTLSSIAVLVLIIACINFMNLSIARYSSRGKEVGLRKVMGAERKGLIFQFLGESVSIATLAGLVALAVVWLFIPIFNQLASANLEARQLLSLGNISAALVVMVMAGCFAGLYPSIVMASFQPAKVLKGVYSSASGKFDLRKALVVGQFTVSLILLIGTLIISDQLQYMRSKNMGFDKDQVIMISAAGTGFAQHYPAFKNLLRDEAGVISVTNLSHDLGQKNLPYFPMIVEGKEEELMMPSMRVGYDFLETFGLKMKEGRFFDISHASDSTQGFIINESAAKSLDWSDPVGRKIRFGVGGNLTSEVIGVIEDFNFDPLRNKVGPLVISFSPAFSNIAVKIKSGEYKTTLSKIETHWTGLVQNRPFAYYFLDDALNQTYESEERLSDIFSYFCGLAILVACMGLFALASFSAERRLKEISVRKVLGASEGGLVLLLYREFLILIIFATILASPLAYYFFDDWLDSFAYRIDLHPVNFMIAFGVLTIIAFVTVGYQSYKAARSNPVEVLRNE